MPPPRPARSARPSVEQLEDRSLLSILFVTSAADSGAGSFRQAILDSNASVGVRDTIEFHIGSGPQTIALLSALPTIADPTDIDGSTQAGFVAAPIVVLNGAGAGASTDGLTITAGNTSVRGLVINGFGGQGIELRTNGNNRIVGNYIGTDASGTAAARYGPPDGTGHGVYILGSSGNTIGGTTAADRNLISGNRGDGIAIAGVNAKQNVIQGNYVGTNAAGTAAVSNYGHGVSLLGTDTDDNVIGGTAPGAGNLLSGSTNGEGIAIVSATASGNTIQGNLIGTNATGTASISNSRGVRIEGPGNTVGGTAPGARNVISGNRGSGVEIVGQANGTLVQGNYVGASSAGGALGNGGAGVAIFSAADTTTQGNLIRNNGALGVYVAVSARPTITGNDIRLNIGGGAYLRAEGGTLSDVVFAENIVYQNTDYGVQLRAFGGVVQNVDVRANQISANTNIGLWVAGYNGAISGLIVRGNLIGTDATGLVAEGNGQYGIYLANTSHARIGGTAPGDRNVISGNGFATVAGFGYSGLAIVGVEQPASYNVVQGNFIGVDITGTRALGNADSGIGVGQNVQNNLIGGDAAGAGNVIGGNGNYGFELGGSDYFGPVTGNVVAGNFIGTDPTGTLDLGNGSAGIFVTANAQNNTFGGLATGAGNVIAFNGGSGIVAKRPPAGSYQTVTGNAFLSNSIYSNSGIGIDLGEDNGVTENDALGHVGPNNFQNFPVLGSAGAAAGTLTVTGSLTSAPNTQFVLQFFASAAANPSGYGEGQRFLGSLTVITDATGAVNFAADFAYGFSAGGVVTATATDPAGNTSEFSAAINVLSGNAPPVVTVPVVGPTVVAGGSVAVTGIRVADPDVGGGSITVTISVPIDAGIVTAGDGGGSAVLNGNGTSVLTITGPLAAVNLALGTVVFVSTGARIGPVRLDVLADDLGSTGSGGAKTGSGAVSILVTAVTSVPPPTLPVVPVPPPVSNVLAVGVEPGVSSQARLTDARTGATLLRVDPFPGFLGGINVATGDVTGDGTPDLIVGAGAGAPGGHVKVYDGATGQLFQSFLSFPGFLGGVNVAAGDIDGDRRADVIVGAGAGAPGGHVKVFSGRSGAEIYSFFAYGMGFMGGASVAAADVDGDGRTDFVTGSGAGAPSGHVKVFSGRSGAEIYSFFAYVGFNGGVRVSAGDLDGDGRAEVLTGTFGAAPHVKVFGPSGQERASFYAFDPARAVTVDVAAVDVDGDGRPDLVATARYGLAPQVRVFRGAGFAEAPTPFDFGDVLGGVEVG